MTFHAHVPDRQTPMGSELIQKEQAQAQLSLDSTSYYHFQHYLLSASPLPHVLKKITRHCWNKYSTQLSCQGAYFINQMGKK